MSLTSKLAKRREGVGEESDDKLHSPKSKGDGGGVGGGVGEALESWYVPHSLFVGSAAPQYFTVPPPFLQESTGMGPESTGIHRNPQEWDWNPQEWDQ